MAVEKNVTDFVHIEFGLGSGALSMAFPDQQLTILSFADDLGLGPIRSLDSKVGSNIRQKWSREFGASEQRVAFKLTKLEWNDNFEILKKSKKPILIWAAKTVNHQIWLRRILSHLPANSKVFTTTPGRFPKAHSYKKNFSQKKPLSIDSKNRLKKEWKVVQKNSTTLLRVLNSKGKIISVESDFFDRKILAFKFLKTPPNRYISAAAIGALLWTEFDCNFEFPAWRLKELVKLGRLKSNLSSKSTPSKSKSWKVKLAK